MWLVVLGVVLSGLKLAGVSVVAAWSWWVVLAPFALAAAWWAIADASGITQRQAMAREAKRAAQRREAQFDSLGLRSPSAGRAPRRGSGSGSGSGSPPEA
jgi:small Trp-rich protein